MLAFFEIKLNYSQWNSKAANKMFGNTLVFLRACCIFTNRVPKIEINSVYFLILMIACHASIVELASIVIYGNMLLKVSKACKLIFLWIAFLVRIHLFSINPHLLFLLNWNLYRGDWDLIFPYLVNSSGLRLVNVWITHLLLSFALQLTTFSFLQPEHIYG